MKPALQDYMPNDTPADERSGTALSWLLGRINYEQALRLPYHAARLRLDRMRELLARLGRPDRGLQLIHVAGTKGKGSTAAMIASVLTAAGYRTGLFSSPHLDRVEERLAVDGQTCSADEFTQLVARVRPVVEAMDAGEPQDRPGDGHSPRAARGRAEHRGPTYFEITTVLAILHFARQRVDAGVLEVGLGGRLDSTNVILPVLSLVTSISLDHTEQLGNTLAAIAEEKAGIIKPGVSVISGVVDAVPRGVIRHTARRLGCRLLEAARDFDFRYRAPPAVDLWQTRGSIDFCCRAPGIEHEYTGLRLNLLGHHQAENAAVALAGIAELRRQGWQLPESAVRKGLAGTSLRVRVEVVGRRPTVVVDAAHNVASAQALVRVLDENSVLQHRILIFSCSQDKDVRGMLHALGPRFDQIVLTRYRHNPRAMPSTTLHAIAQEVTTAACCVRDHPAEAWSYVRQVADDRQLLVITGSIYIAAEMRRLVRAQPVAPLSLSAPDAV